ncbi:MAG: slipin family protein [Polyangiaceae bacterium]|nr:slipin family protein [Myxococcales bacterium]MCB9584715.1 slipin family protein [Polyangiaceae bacterium]
MFKIIHVPMNQRVIVQRHGVPRFALGPGRHVIWGFGLSDVTLNVEALEFWLAPELRAVLDPAWFQEVTLQDHERAVITRDGVPKIFLRPGVHRFWSVDPSVALVRFDVREPLVGLTKELLALIPDEEIAWGRVEEHQAGLLFVQGRLVRVLEPGQFALWATPERSVQVKLVDLRQQQLPVVGQELLTKDKVGLRVSVTLEFAVVDPVIAVTRATAFTDSLHLGVQLALREFVAGMTLDELLEARQQLTQFLAEQVAPTASALGVELRRIGVKDFILPGAMQVLMNRVIEAEKEAQANVILRREETAATRALANTAKVMADNPVLLRLKELDALKEIAQQIDQVRLVVGAEQIAKLMPKLGP